VVHVDRADDGRVRVEHVGGVPSAAHADFHAIVDMKMGELGKPKMSFFEVLTAMAMMSRSTSIMLSLLRLGCSNDIFPVFLPYLADSTLNFSHSRCPHERCAHWYSGIRLPAGLYAH